VGHQNKSLDDVHHINSMGTFTYICCPRGQPARLEIGFRSILLSLLFVFLQQTAPVADPSRTKHRSRCWTLIRKEARHNLFKFVSEFEATVTSSSTLSLSLSLQLDAAAAAQVERKKCTA